ncbi:MAG: DUF308 domain-containing protein, partial [Prevotella sp.]
MRLLQSSVFRAVVAIIVGALLVKYREDTVTWLTIAIGILFFLSGLTSVIIYYANKRNVFILDKKAQELSRERGELVLCCQWLDADGSFSEAEYISLEQLKYDTENFKPYYVDADEIYYKANPAV